MSTTRRFAGASVCLVALALVQQPTCGPPPTPDSSSQHEENMAEAAALLKVRAVPFLRTELDESLDELEPLRGMVGDARVVSLGEGTHGTREFFQMKARILRFLVERMGFAAFAIEATWPEANRLDRYVRTAEGDPAVLLSGLYFWTWNTEEVLEMIRWMRSYNAAGGSVGFYGFDMQYPGMAIQNVTQFVGAVDPPAASEFMQRLECLARYANDARGRFPSPTYKDQPQAYRDACLGDLQWVPSTLAARRARYEAASSAAEWARADQSARVAVQFEESESGRRTRDDAMADNVKWLVDQLPQGGKIVLWAHNGHVAVRAGFMGQPLRDRFGAAMIVVGFDFGHGSFTARLQSGATCSGLATQTIGDPPEYSYEDYFLNSRIPRFILDLRDLSKASAPWLAGPRQFRSIGACYDEQRSYQYYYLATLPAEFDAIIFFDESSPSRVLPFTYPTEF